MKINAARGIHYDSGPNMTPLVDVVMVILIFLMLAGSFAGSSTFLISKQGIHQKGVGSAKADPNKPIETPIDIHINSKVAIDGTSTFLAEATGIPATNNPEDIK